MKGIILAGGTGSRLWPITLATSKQLVPIYDKPMIYYPLSVLMQAGIRDILIITTPEDQENFKRLLKDGSQLGVNISYAVQPEPKGLAQAFTIGESFIGNDTSAMILGDNIFYGSGLEETLQNARKNAENGYATIFGYEVKDPQRFGIMEINESKDGVYVLSVEEKPEYPKSNYAITGLYFYPKGVSKKASEVTPSKRGELEITTLNDMYLKDGILKAELLKEGYTWFDTGTDESLYESAGYIKAIQNNRDMVICCPEAIAHNNGWINDEKLYELGSKMAKNNYGKYLIRKSGRKM